MGLSRADYNLRRRENLLIMKEHTPVLRAIFREQSQEALHSTMQLVQWKVFG
jgi:hypothetical protein